MSVSNVIIVKTGSIRKLTDHSYYKYYTEGEHIVEFKLTREAPLNCRVLIPDGFLTDGNSGGPDYGLSWLFHDFLYATHVIENRWRDPPAIISCTREEADALMSAILELESITDPDLKWFARWFEWGFTWASTWNILWAFSKVWESSGTRGPEYFNSNNTNID